MTLLLPAVIITAGLGGVTATGWWWRRRSRRRRAAAWRRAHELFTRLVELPPDARAGVLAAETGDDPTLCDAVTRLLAAHDVTGPLDRMQWRLDGSSRAEPTLPSAAAEAAETIVAGHYRLLGRLGAGGMGEVHRAHDERLGRDVAIKFLATRDDRGQQAQQRFVREARAAAALDHPNLCTVHEIGESDDGRLFIAMALYDGETLADRIRRGPLDWTEAVGIARQVARGLACAHAAGVVHRDIKPANICITREGVAKVVDFGIAMVAGTTIGDAGPLVGTVAYMSPEQVQGQLAAEQSDLWSLGVVCYEMLTAARLFGGSDWLQVMAAIRGDDPLPLGALRGTAPLPVIRVIRQLLERDPARRPDSADQVDRLLAEAMRGADRAEQDDASAEAALAADGERRQVTVVVGRLPAAAGAVLSPGLVAEVLQRHGGHCNHCDDQRLELVFGVPRTHEDDQRRAARAAAELHELATLGDAAGAAPSFGIASATVEVRLDPDRSGHFRIGDPVVAEADRLAALAPPGAILACEPNHRVLAGQFEIAPFEVGDLPAGPMPGTTVRLRPATGSDGGVVERRTAFVGRQHELDALQAAWQSLHAGEGRVVTVTGEAGSGKSRLLHEFIAPQNAAAFRVVSGHCQSHGGSKPYHPFIEAVRQLLRLDDGDGTEGATVTAEAVGVALDGIDPMLRGFLSPYLHLLTIGTGEPAVPQEMYGGPTGQALRDALIALFSQAALARPVVLLLEDWHWADEASADVLGQLAGMTVSCPILIVVTQRTDGTPAWQGAERGTLLGLAPLPIDDSTAIARAILDVPNLSDEIAATLHERSGGNPLYLEELCRSLHEGGLLRVDGGEARLSRDQDQLHLPATIQGIIRSRLDRLPPDSREVVRAAAVLGRDFSLPLLLRMGLERYAVTQVLQSLAGLGLVQQVRVVPDRAYRFSHALIHEVAYDTLLPHQRRELHRRAARALLAEYGDQLDAYASRIALQHEGSEEWLEAARFACLAARRSQRLHEPADGLATLEAADAWLDRAAPGPVRDEVRAELLFDAEALCETLGFQDRQGDLLERLMELPTVRENPGRLAEVHRRRGDRFTLRRDFASATGALEMALELARQAGDMALEGRVLRSLGLVGWHGGDFEPALPHLEAAIAIERARKDTLALASSLLGHAQLLKGVGRGAEAIEELEEGLRITQDLPDPAMSSVMLYTLGIEARAMGDIDRAADYLRRATELEPGMQNPVYRAFNLVARAHVCLIRGELDQAIRYAEESVEQARRGGFAEATARSLHSLGEMLASLDRDGEALVRLEEAASIYDQLGRSQVERRLWRRIAMVAERSRDLQLAHRAWSRCLDLAGDDQCSGEAIGARLGVIRTGRRSMAVGAATARRELEQVGRQAREAGLASEEAHALNSLGVLAWESGDLADALVHFRTALECFTRLADTAHMAVMHNSLGATLRGLGRREEARRHLEAALPLARDAGNREVEGHALALLGEIALDAGDAGLARTHIRASLALRLDRGDLPGEGWMREALARIACRCGRLDAALGNLMRARAIALCLEDDELLAACNALKLALPVTQEG